MNWGVNLWPENGTVMTTFRLFYWRAVDGVGVQISCFDVLIRRVVSIAM